MDSAAPAPIPARTLYSPWQRLALIAVGGLFALIGGLAWFTDLDVAGMVIYAVGGGFGLWIAVRGGMAGVRIDEKGITERGLGRSRAVGWCSIRAVAPADQGAGPLKTVFTELVLTDGTTRPLQVVASYFPRAAEADLHVITTAHAAHRATCQTCTT